MKNRNVPFKNGRLDMVNAFVSEATIDELFGVAPYLHLPEINEDLVLAYSREKTETNKGQTLFIYQSGDFIKTARPLESLLNDYGTLHEIEEWLPFQRTLAELIDGAVQFPPYATLHSVFLKICSDSLINLNHISGYERSKLSGQSDTHTNVTLTTGGITEITLGYKSFHRKYHEGALMLIALRKLFRFVYPKEKRHSIYEEPSALNPFLINYLKNNNLEGFKIPMKVFKKTYGFFETVEKQLKNAEITPELIAQYDAITRKLIAKYLVTKQTGREDTK